MQTDVFISPPADLDWTEIGGSGWVVRSRCRVKGIWLRFYEIGNGGTNPISVTDGVNGPTKFTIPTVVYNDGASNLRIEMYMQLPGEGVLFKDGPYISGILGTGVAGDTIQVVYA
jgi:hypothetical protein